VSNVLAWRFPLNQTPFGALGTRPAPRQLRWRAMLDAVDNWPLAILIAKQLGGKPMLITASGVIGGRYPPLAGSMLHGVTAPAPNHLCSGQPCGELSGGNWMVVRGLRDSSLGLRAAAMRLFASPSVYNSTLRGRGRASASPFKIVTWLILPVVICLSQRLSHACLSISNYTVKLRMAH
jgi:hypothetical protein